MIALQSNITCPACEYSATETMPIDACQVRYSCRCCSYEMRPKADDCCVFCSYGSVACPPVQEERAGVPGAISNCCGVAA
jgi:hypothetical protein